MGQTICKEPTDHYWHFESQQTAQASNGQVWERRLLLRCCQCGELRSITSRREFPVRM